jgi:4-amino-4-deoxy-L-arabinose transferase-like glycosyltransferase
MRQWLNRLWQHPGHLIWIVAAYFPLLGGMSVPLTGDQKVYLSTAIEMRERGSWLLPILFGETSYYKPPLQYWATLVGWKIFGFGLWGALVPSALCVLATAWLVGEIARLLHEKRPFVNAGLWFAAALGTATYGTVAQMEIYVALFYAASWWAGLRFLARPYDQRRWGWIFLAFLIAGVSAWVKSPLYSVFWVAGFVSYLLVSGEWELFGERRLYAAWGLGAAVGAGWYAAVLAVDGARFWADYALRETWHKASGNGSTPLGFWAAILTFFFPLALLVVPSVRALWKGRRTGEIARFLICWSWPPALFFTFYPYRVRPYAFILVPALALLVDWGYFRFGRSRAFRATTIVSGALFAVAGGAVALVLARGELVPVWVALGLALSGLSGFALAATDRMRGFALAALAAVFFFRAAAVSLGEEDLRGLREARVIARGAPLGMIDENKNIWHEVGLISTGLGETVARMGDLKTAAEFLAKGGQLALTVEQRDALRPHLPPFEDLPWLRWKGRLKFPYRELILHGRSAVADFDSLTRREFRVVRIVEP